MSSRDENHYKADVDTLMDEILPVVEKFYASHGVKMLGGVYDSKSSEYEASTTVSFVITIPENQYYPEFYFKISKLGSAVLSPKDRLFEGVFILRGASKEFMAEMYKTHKIPSLIMTYNLDSFKNKTPTEKLENLFEQAKPILETWKNFKIMTDIFVF